MKAKTANVLYPALFFVLLLGAWQYFSMRETVAFWILPSPLRVFAVFTNSSQLMWHHLRFTLYATVAGLAISILWGIVTAVLLDSVRLVRQTLYPYMVVSQTVPILALAPLIIIWMGYGLSSKVFTVSLICFFPIALSLYDGFRQVSIEQIRLLKSMNASSWQIFRYLKMPAALPNLFTGLKLSATYSVMGAVIGEMLGGHAGLGIYMNRATKSFQTDHVFAIIIVIIALSMSLFGLICIIDRFFLKWHYQKVEEYEDTINGNRA